MRRPTCLALLASATLLAAGLTGCGDDPASGGGGGSEQEKVWEPSSDVPTQPGSDGLTPPGAVLEPGDTAKLMIADSILSDAQLFPAEVTVGGDAIVEGDREAVLAAFGDQPMFEADEIGEQVWYVRFTLEAGADAAFLHGTVKAVDAQGETMYSLSREGFDGCAMALVPASGGTAETCSIVSGDERPVAVSWDTGAEAYDDDPVLWYLG